MGPVKFDDIPKAAASILNDDYHTSGFQLKTKQKTTWHGSSFSSQVDLFDGEHCATPAKLTLAMPKPFGLGICTVNKLEMDKGGKFKLEASKDGLLKDLKFEVKSDLVDLGKVTIGKTYTGVKDTQLKVDVKLTNPQDFTAEATHARGGVTCGMKCNGSVLSGGLPDFGARYTHGPLFFSLLATKKLGAFDFAASYKVNPDVRVAACGQATQKAGLASATAGLVYMDSYKAKASLDGSLAVSGKYEVAKGFSLLGGFKYSSKGVTYGCQASLS